MTDVELLAAFEDASLPNDAFRHGAHLRAGFLFLRREPLLPALARFRAALRRFATAKGASGLYHETLTLGWLLLIRDRMGEGRPDESWEAFALRNPDLFEKPSPLERAYGTEVLAGAAARERFVLPEATGPDLRPKETAEGCS